MSSPYGPENDPNRTWTNAPGVGSRPAGATPWGGSAPRSEEQQQTPSPGGQGWVPIPDQPMEPPSPQQWSGAAGGGWPPQPPPQWDPQQQGQMPGAQPQWGGPPQQPPSGQWSSGQWGSQPGWDRLTVAKPKKTGVIVSVVVVAVLVIGAIVGVLALTSTDQLDQQAVQQGVQKVLSDSYGVSDATDVSCPKGQKVEVGHSFSCSVKIGGDTKKVDIQITQDNGTYEVGKPS